MSNAGDTETGENSGSPGHLTQHRNMSRIGSPHPVRRARMPSKGLRGALEEYGCNHHDGEKRRASDQSRDQDDRYTRSLEDQSSTYASSLTRSAMPTVRTGASSRA
jgi:hypothetical protein